MYYLAHSLVMLRLQSPGAYNAGRIDSERSFMSEKNSKPKKLSLSGSGKLTLGGGGLDQTALRGGVSASRGKNVQVEVRRKRVVNPALRAAPSTQPETPSPNEGSVETSVQADDRLTAAERANRIKVLQEGLSRAQTATDESKQSEVDDEEKKAVDPRESRRRSEMAELAEIEKKAVVIRQTEMERLATENAQRQARGRVKERDVNSTAPLPVREDAAMRGRRRPEEAEAPRRPANQKRGTVDRRRTGKMTISQALSEGDSRQRSLASVRRQREKARMREDQPQVKQVRDVVIPDTIAVQELANRMAERAADIVKELMKQGIMATVTQTIDAETAELVTMEFGHRVQRVSDSDIEDGLTGAPDDKADLKPRPPVVTVMGHVDHGKTSLLDAIRATDVAASESGGITQHIGAYQIETGSGNLFTFIDTPGHEAFTEMRSRGATTTDIVILVVAADDSVKTQTIEAINHAKAAGCPIIVAVNKCDKPEADPRRVRNDLLQHEIVTEDFGGDILCVDVSAHSGLGLDKLEEAILLQAELLELKANPDRDAEGIVVEAKVERGRGSVATILVQRGTLRVGDVFVTGAESGRVRALLNDRGKQLKSAFPGQPVEVLGLNGTPMAGDQFSVVETESRAREIAEYRSRRNKDKQAAVSARGSVEQMLTAIAAGEAEELPIVIKTDVHGSLEAIRNALAKLGTDQVKARVLTGGVGALSESDISLAAASQAMVIGFNVRAIPQARDLAKRDNVEIRYHSIIYELIDEVKAAMGGLLSPETQEEFIGYAEIRQVFSVSKSGKVAGCMVTEGIIKRGCKVRLLRDNVVIHEGSLKTLRRFKDEVKEVRESMECGMAFENYSDIQEGDMIECFEIKEVARKLD